MISTEYLDPRGDERERNPKPSEEVEIEEVKQFDNHNYWSIKIEKHLPEEFKKKLVTLLKKYHECFAWSAVDMLGIDHKIACHKLAIDPSFKPVQQKKRRHG